MAGCTLDDLVPSFKCKRVFLEPLGTSDSEYGVFIEGCLQDRIEDDGIAEYLLSETFQENIKLKCLLYRGSNFQRLVDFLEISGLSKSLQSFILWYVIDNLTNGYDIYELMLDPTTGYPDILGETVVVNGRYDVYGSGAFQNETDGATTFEEIFRALTLEAASTYQYAEDQHMNWNWRTLDFGTEIQGHTDGFGERTLDENGDIVYELIIKRSDLEFRTPTNTKTIYFYAIPYFDVDMLTEDVTIPLTSDTVNFFYKDIHTCHILNEKIAASPNVQDFRLTERIEEIIRPDRISSYDDFINKISLISTEDLGSKSSMTTDLFLSYKKEAGERVHTHGVFYLKPNKLLRKKTKYPFLYNFIETIIDLEFHERDSQELFSSIIDLLSKDLEYIKMNIYRIRTDVDDDNRKEIVATFNNVEKLQFSSTMHGFSFNDYGYRDLTYGTYRYEVEMQFVDPIHNFVEERIHKMKYGISVYKNVIEYIHNNPQNYNELRDELNGSAQSDIKEILNLESDSGITREDWENAFYDLFFMFTGVSLQYQEAVTITKVILAAFINTFGGDFNDTQPLLVGLKELLMFASDDDKYERRKLENHLRIMQDLMFAIGKFYEVDSVNSVAASSIQSPKELISYSRIWNAEVSPQSLHGGVIKLSSDATLLNGFSESDFQARMQQETDLFGLSSIYGNSSNFGSVTPVSIDGTVMEEVESTNTVINLFSNLLEMGKIGQSELKYYEDLLDNNENYSATVKDVKNNSGMFESFLAKLGGTCENLDISSINLYPDSSKIRNKKRDFSKGIDDGENKRAEDVSPFGRFTSFGSDDSEGNVSIEDQKSQIKQELFLEARKKENIIMKVIVNPNGYAAMDRKEFIQGESQTVRYAYDYNFNSEVQNHPHVYPSLFWYNAGKKLLNQAENGLISTSNHTNDVVIPYSRFIMDNVHIVYYLKSIDENMTPTWEHLTDIELAKESAYNGTLFCKFQRYENSSLKIGQGASSDREILSKYFYLYV